MNTPEIIAFTRQALHDKVVDYLWPDETLLGWLNEAQEKAARNARLIRDASTPEVCRIDITATKQAYDLDPRVVFVRRVLVASKPVPIRKISYKDLDHHQAGWMGRSGTPDRWCTDLETGKLWFNRKPTAADVATLLVVRMPLEQLTLTTKSCPEIPPAYHRPLHHWVCFRALSDQDSEACDPKAAEKHRAEFMVEFGEDSRAIDEEWERQHYGDEDGEGEL